MQGNRGAGFWKFDGVMGKVYKISGKIRSVMLTASKHGENPRPLTDVT